jgi:hypothetical protein
MFQRKKNKIKFKSYNILHQTQMHYYHFKGEVKAKKKKQKTKHNQVP